ncbi:YafY family protein [Bacteroides sp. 51]|uniref:helix-turn-helix transcriptional regulator n=1 Tax=Bacteroides sp. 51 TaxID=2302938 RepID=UPI0013D38619|nr:WYL domain-containing protein [Bacteroides sp. 51]NDV84541.1 WYL domain-containing protein [Bacteroides sp. 51]
MPTNKHAQIRYKALDECFSNFGRRYYMEDLVEACCKAILDKTGSKKGVSKRQVQYDINHMETEWDIPLQRLPDGKKMYYRYDRRHYSIYNQPLDPTEINQLRETLTMLNRFRGMPHFEWMEEITARLEETFLLKEDNPGMVEFAQNPYLKGLNHFTDIFNAILNKQVLSITYKRFAKEAVAMIIHPWFLKQYNNRWFLFGLNDDLQYRLPVTNLALDRIESLTFHPTTYIENKGIDFEEYFYDVVGVTVYWDKPIEKVILRVERPALYYIETKPLHGSQRIKEIKDHCAIIELKLQINYEFETSLLTYADCVEIIEPQSLKEAIQKRAKTILDKNS